MLYFPFSVSVKIRLKVSVKMTLIINNIINNIIYIRLARKLAYLGSFHSPVLVFVLGSSFFVFAFFIIRSVSMWMLPSEAI